MANQSSPSIEASWFNRETASSLTPSTFPPQLTPPNALQDFDDVERLEAELAEQAVYILLALSKADRELATLAATSRFKTQQSAEDDVASDDTASTSIGLRRAQEPTPPSCDEGPAQKKSKTSKASSTARSSSSVGPATQSTADLPYTQAATPPSSDEAPAPKKIKKSKASTVAPSSAPTTLATQSAAVIGILQRIYNHKISSSFNDGTSTPRQAPTNCWACMTMPTNGIGENDRDDAQWLPFLTKLGLVPGVFPNIHVKDKASQPGKRWDLNGNTSQPDKSGKMKTKTPEWHFLMYVLLAVSPQGRLKQNTLYNLALAWCSWLPAKNQSCRRILCTKDEFIKEEGEKDDKNGGWYRLAREGESKPRVTESSKDKTLETEGSDETVA